MDLEDVRTLLKKTRVRELDSTLRKEVFELALELGNETTITTKSNLHFVFELYQKERVKDKKSRKMLKKAERIIATLAALNHVHHQKKEQGTKEETTIAMPRQFSGSMPDMRFSRRIVELFESVGITDRREMERIVSSIGEREVENRIEAIQISRIDREVVKALFGKHTELLCIPVETAFFETIESIEKKGEFIDAHRGSVVIPERIDYKKFPDVLLRDMGELVRDLNMDTTNKVTVTEATVERAEEQKRPKYVARTMRTSEMITVLAALGYELDRSKNELVYTLRADRRREGMSIVLTTSNPGDGGEYEKGVVRMIIRDIGIATSEFERVRRSV